MDLAELTTYPIPGFSEPFCSMSHLLAAGVFAVLSFLLIRHGRGNRLRVLALGVFAFSCVFLLSMSGVYHLLEPGGSGRNVLRRLDHAAIFGLIAGTFTAVHAILFRGFWRWGMILLIWAIAATGITLKTIFFQDVAEWLGLVFYIGMGWIGLVSGLKIWRDYDWKVLKPVLWGGLVYSAGAALDILRWPDLIPGVVGPHEIFHVAVIVGLSLHWSFVYRFTHQLAENPGNEINST